MEGKGWSSHFTSYVNEKDRGRKKSRGTRTSLPFFVWWRIEYPPSQWKGEENLGKKRVPENEKEQKGFLVFELSFYIGRQCISES
jgi:hypothetical protein